ncbi:MAG: hypothetical protein ACOYJC_08305 [Christensenellales bacterium]|jgi:hypothetical protein
MNKALYNGMIREKMCFQKILFKTLDLGADRKDFKIILEDAPIELGSV